ncbi:Thioesterase/thiol ester dehydrase-isomerase [Trichoderma longibrachiatum ATCC 18648]|uniref:Thioesterase/thiol ester dehydrase-isomerase n=1 Tax=Trichoderma longibrachiatum ATCC 18648 TaxID=983965 RepID=A0A2T4CIB1_TRILO|nr:Thioesterase/thiol ester dehydrase-isomerase [Trichoderma longibrachiatum ATCC 18648]
MSGPGVGFEYPPQPVAWLKRDVLLFANSIGVTADELHYLYELHPNFAVFPTYPTVLPFKGDSQEVIDFYASQKKTKIPGVPDFDSRRVVDGQRKIEFLKPLPKPDWVLEHHISKEAAHLYRLNGDYNPLHATPEPGVKMGFPGAIMHGLYSWNATAHCILKALAGSDPAHIKEYQARFASPVMPGDKLVISVWRTGEKKGDFEEIRFVVAVENGKVCLSNGRALVKILGDVVGDIKGKL